MINKFRGLFTALVTPFKENGEIDFSSLEKLLDMQLNAKVDGLVLLGTTGEKMTLTKNECLEIVSFSTNFVKGRTKIIVNIGTNNTNESISDLKEFQKKFNIDAFMAVNPYYNKPTQDGMFFHFSKLAEESQIPLILYNIQSRTGVNLHIDTISKLIEFKNILAIKESSGDLLQVMNLINKFKDRLNIISGEEPLNYTINNLGGSGAISVLSNILPKEVKKLIDLSLNFKKEALDLHYKLYELSKLIFSIGNNPTAVKTIMAKKGLIKENFRLPICKLKSEEVDFLISNFNKELEKIQK